MPSSRLACGGVLAVGRDAVDLAAQKSGEAFEWLDSAANGPRVPFTEEVHGVARISVVPQALQVVDQNVDRCQPAVDGEKFLQPNPIPMFEVHAVSRQQPAGTLDDLPSPSVGLSLGFGCPRLANPLSAILRQPRQVLDLPTTSGTRRAESLDQHVRFRVEDGQLPDPPLVPVVMSLAGLTAARADQRNRRTPAPTARVTACPKACLRVPLSEPHAFLYRATTVREWIFSAGFLILHGHSRGAGNS